MYAAAWNYSVLWKSLYTGLLHDNPSVHHLLLGSGPVFLKSNVGIKSLALKTGTIEKVALALKNAALLSNQVAIGLSFTSLAYCSSISIFLYMAKQEFPGIQLNLTNVEELIRQGMELINKKVENTAPEALSWLTKVKLLEDEIRLDIVELESYQSKIAFWKPYSFAGLLVSGGGILLGGGAMLVIGLTNPLVALTVGSVLGFGLSIYNEKEINTTLTEAIKVINQLKVRLESVQEIKQNLNSISEMEKEKKLLREENELLTEENESLTEKTETLEQDVAELKASLKVISGQLQKEKVIFSK